MDEVPARLDLLPIQPDDKVEMAPSFFENALDVLWVHLFKIDSPVELAKPSARG